MAAVQNGFCHISTILPCQGKTPYLHFWQNPFNPSVLGDKNPQMAKFIIQLLVKIHAPKTLAFQINITLVANFCFHSNGVEQPMLIQVQHP